MSKHISNKFKMLNRKTSLISIRGKWLAKKFNVDKIGIPQLALCQTAVQSIFKRPTWYKDIHVARKAIRKLLRFTDRYARNLNQIQDKKEIEPHQLDMLSEFHSQNDPNDQKQCTLHITNPERFSSALQMYQYEFFRRHADDFVQNINSDAETFLMEPNCSRFRDFLLTNGHLDTEKHVQSAFIEVQYAIQHKIHVTLGYMIVGMDIANRTITCRKNNEHVQFTLCQPLQNLYIHFQKQRYCFDYCFERCDNLSIQLIQMNSLSRYTMEEVLMHLNLPCASVVMNYLTPHQTAMPCGVVFLEEEV